MSRYCYVNTAEEVDYAELVPFLLAEYDGFVIAHGKPVHSGLMVAALCSGTDTLEVMFPVQPQRNGTDKCRYCKHERQSHGKLGNMPQACDHGLCVCFKFEEQP